MENARNQNGERQDLALRVSILERKVSEIEEGLSMLIKTVDGGFKSVISILNDQSSILNSQSKLNTIMFIVLLSIGLAALFKDFSFRNHYI